MIGILELLILVVVVPVVILMAAAVVRYLSQQNVSRLLIFGGLAVLGFLFLAGPGLFIVRNMSSSSIQNVQEATAVSPQDVEYPVRLEPKRKGIQAEIPQATVQEKINDNQPWWHPSPLSFKKPLRTFPQNRRMLNCRTGWSREFIQRCLRKTI